MSSRVIFPESESDFVVLSCRLTTSEKKHVPADPAEGELSAPDLLGKEDTLPAGERHKSREESYRSAIRTNPNCAESWKDLGLLLEDTGRFPEAAVCLMRRLEIEKTTVPHEVPKMLRDIAGKPGWKGGQFTLGRSYWYLHEYERARLHLEIALRLDPALVAQVHIMYAQMHFDQKEWTEAIADADCALAANPNSYIALMVRSMSLNTLGRPSEAIETLRRANEVRPTSDLHSCLLFSLNYVPDATPEMIYDEACRWNQRYGAPLASEIRAHLNTPDPDRRIRLGYLSPDLYNHALMKFVPPIFERSDRSQFEMFVYAVGPKVEPQVGNNLEHYVPLPESPDEIASRIYDDRIDILVDLAGHTAQATLLALARKPAPIQVSWMGCNFTTGLSTIDYFLGDRWLPAPDTEHLFTEIVYRLPRTACCYRPFCDPPVAPSPCWERGYITFGSYNNPRKINREVVKLWSAILHLVPRSRLLLKSGGLETAEMQSHFRQWFAEDGIPGDRLRFDGSTPPAEYMNSYADIDIALDPFPYGGGSTTLDTLWMGVPIVTSTGRLAVHAATPSALHAMGLPNIVAQTPEQYLEQAVLLAQTVQPVSGLRHNIRQALKSSPLMDEAGFVRDLEAAYRDMWRTWCRKTQTKYDAGAMVRQLLLDGDEQDSIQRM